MFQGAATAQDERAAANGWTRRQLLGMRHPEWITYGWADPPPDTTAKD